MRISDTLLIKISLTVSGVGIALLLLLQSQTNLSFAEVYVTEDDVQVSINGTIIDSRISGNTTFLVLEQECVLPVILFEPKEFVKGQLLITTGTVQTYKSKKEIIIG